jgi:cyclophilin family peptidyl-prolyl cis-trans isomerase
VQGGDPTGSGWGGPPGVTLPAEPSVTALGGTFQRGAVGVADAGPDTGGSQFFIMHSRAAHLEGRYTQLGYVTEGLEVIDRLIVGDRVLRASVVNAGE